MIALTIDEKGMAKTAEKKLAIARRIYDLAVNTFGMRPHDLIFDTLTFTLGSGEEEFRRAGIETIEGIRLIKRSSRASRRSSASAIFPSALPRRSGTR